MNQKLISNQTGIVKYQWGNVLNEKDNYSTEFLIIEYIFCSWTHFHPIKTGYYYLH